MSTRIEKQIEEAKQYVETLQILAAQGDSQMRDDLITLANTLWKYKINNTLLIDGFNENSYIGKFKINGDYRYTAYYLFKDFALTPRKLNNLNDAIARITPNIRVANLYDKLAFTYSFKAKP